MAGQISPDKILQVGTGFFASKTLLSAIEMELFTTLAAAPGDLASIETRLGLHPRSSRDFLDALVALGFLQRNGGVYRNAPETEVFLDKAKPSYLGGILEMCNHRLYGFWGNLTRALRTGKPQNEAASGETDVFEKLYADQDRLKGFLSAMSGISRGANLAIAEKFPWADYKTVCDVGAAQGDTLTQICSRHQHLSGIGFDLPPVQPVFEEYIAANGLADRVRFAPGSFFTDPVPSAQVITMGHILHDWNLEEKKMLAAKAYAALPEDGAVIIYETLIDNDRRENAFGLLMSLNMLIETPGGFDYTGADCEGWLREAGFRQTRVEHLAGPHSMVVGIK
jgi:hypothetical protein